jgi:hypothetical protein
MGMRVGGAGSSTAMAAWQSRMQDTAMASAASQPAAPKAAEQAASANSAATQQFSAALTALATGSVSLMA